MISAPVPSDEAERIAALAATGLVGTPGDYALDCITRAAAKLFDVPYALISLVDSEHQYFKASVGLDTRWTARDISFCSHVVASGRAMIVEDALRDIRFADNPLVCAAPFVRLYVGHPIRSAKGAILGTLCLLHYKTRKFTYEDCVQLQELAFLAEQTLQAHQLSAIRRSLVSRLAVAEREALLDPLLHTWNRTGIVEILREQEEERLRVGTPYSILMLDVDRFKAINDTHGHLIGDSVLRMVARTVSATLRSGDELGRFGGDEFLIVFPNTNVSDGERLGRRLEAAVAAMRVGIPGGAISCTISVGAAARGPEHKGMLEPLVHQADLAMLASKHARRAPLLERPEIGSHA
jgi:diguanylate cyclase (GGDEF)-like protein